MQIRSYALAAVLAALLLACGGSEKLTQSEWERYQEIRGETQTLLNDLHQATINAASKGEAVNRYSVLEAHQELLAPDNIEFLKRVEVELEDSVAAARVVRLGLYLTDCALESLRLRYLIRTPLLTDARELPAGKRWRGGLPTPLLLESDREQRDLQYSRWLSLLYENLDLADAWWKERDSLLQSYGYDSWKSYLTQRLGFDSEELLNCTRAFVAATDGLYGELLGALEQSGRFDWVGKPSKLDLVRFMQGKGSLKPPMVYPARVVIDGLRGSCAAAEDLVERVTFKAGPSSSMPVAVPIAAPAEVALVLPPVGDQRQMARAVVAYGEALTYASSESRDFVDLYLERDLDRALAGEYLAALYVIGDCEMSQFTLSFPAEFLFRRLFELRFLCADLQLALTWSPGAISSSDTLLALHSRALGTDVAMAELAPRLFQTDFYTAAANFQGLLTAYELLPDRYSLNELLSLLKEEPLRFDLKQCRVDSFLRACARLLRE